jgi:hypothetical protein
MNITVKEIIIAKDALSALANHKLPIKTSYSISKLIRIINKELESFNSIRQTIIRNYVPEGEQITPELNEHIMKDMNAELEKIVSISLNKIDLSSLNIEINARDIIALEPFCIFDTTTLE